MIDPRVLRLQIHPHHAHYSAMKLVFRPHVMYVQEPNYQSAAVNTDGIGLRRQYHKGNKRLNIETLATEYEHVDVLVGNSTVFGVDCSSDKKTISHYLNDEFRTDRDIPTINFGLRGATSRQELVNFQALQDRLPTVRRVLICSGILGATMIALPSSFIHPEYGTIFSEKYCVDLWAQEYRRYDKPRDQMIRAALLDCIEKRIAARPQKFSLIKQKLELEFPDSPSLPDFDRLRRTEIVMRQMRADLMTWGALGRGAGIEMVYILQPAIGWTNKVLSSNEKALFQADITNKRLCIEEYANREFYEWYRSEIGSHCTQAGVEFHDANVWFDQELSEVDEVFSDVCHLTDFGNRELARMISERTRVNG